MKLKILLVTLTSLALLAATPSVVLAQHEHQQHAMHGSGDAVAQLQLQDGRKWPTDAPLRLGMASIRAAFDADHPAIHAGKQTDDQYAALATRIDQQVKSIVANCRLPADADANCTWSSPTCCRGFHSCAARTPRGHATTARHWSTVR